MNRVKKFGIYLMFFLNVFYSFAYPIDLNSLYGLTNETPPGVVSLGKGGYFVSGGGFYIHPTPPSSPGNIFTATPPQLNASCGSLDAFLGGIGFGGFSLLVQKFQAILMALPIVAFKIALAILAPQVSTILDNIERITDALNNMQIGQCGQIHGLDVHEITSAIGNIKGALSQNYASQASQNAKNFYEQISNPSNWNISTAIDTWNKYVNDTWQQISQTLSVNGPNGVASVNFAQDPSIMDNAVNMLSASGQFPNASVYTNQQIRQFVRALIGDINMNAINSGSTSLAIDPVEGGKYGAIQQTFDNLVNCGTVKITPFNTRGYVGLDVSSQGASNGLGLFCNTNFYNDINELYTDIEQGNQIQSGTNVYNTEQLLASVSYVPALAVIEWGAVVSSANGDTTASDPLATYIDAKLAKAVAIEVTYAFFSDYINLVAREMKSIVNDVASGKISAGQGKGEATQVSRAVRNEVVKHMEHIQKRASDVLNELVVWRNNRLQNSGKQLKDLAEKSGKLRDEAFSILKGMGLYSTYLKAVGG